MARHEIGKLKTTSKTALAAMGLLDLLATFCESENEACTAATMLMVGKAINQMYLNRELIKGKMSDGPVVERLLNDIFEFAKERIEKEARQATSSN
jgi:hypothetical protein